MSDAIFIVGYYRSGTSALSGALMRGGVKFYNEADEGWQRGGEKGKAQHR